VEDKTEQTVIEQEKEDLKANNPDSDALSVSAEAEQKADDAPTQTTQEALSSSVGEEVLQEDSDKRNSEIAELITAGFDKLSHQFEHKLVYDQTKQQQIDTLHNELQKYRSDLIAKTNRPLVNGIIRLHDDIEKIVAKFETKPKEPLSRDRLIKILLGTAEDIEILLDQNGVLAFQEPLEAFNPQRQRSIRSIATDDAALNGRVAERLRPGFEQGDEILRKETVTVYVSDKSVSEEHTEKENATIAEPVPQPPEEEKNV
jgi:molecular chaperone GrpE